MQATTTLGQLLTSMYSSMNDSSDNTTYASNNRDKDKINDVARRFCSGLFESLIVEGKLYKCNDMVFLRDRQYLEFKSYISITKEINIGDTEIELDTTNLDTTGAIYVQGMIISYTGKEATKITGCSGIIANFAIGTTVAQIYPVNVNMDKPYRMFYLNEKNEEQEIFPVEQTSDMFGRNKFRNFTLVYDENTSKQYILLRGFSNGDRFLLKYYKEYTEMVEEDDICIIPDDYAKAVIPFIAAGELLLESEAETAERQGKLRKGYAALNESFIKINRISKDPKKMVQFAKWNFDNITPVGRTGYTKTGFRLY